MNHFDENLIEGQNLFHHHSHLNEQLNDKSTNSSNLMAQLNQQMPSPFDSSPKASMFFFSLNSPRNDADKFPFNQLNAHYSKNSKDHFQPINRRLEFEQDASLFCKQEELQYQQASAKQSQRSDFQSSEGPSKSKKINKSKNSKGLKKLSIGVYDIVAEKIQTNYKEVAHCLIDKIIKRMKQLPNQDQGYENLRKLQKDEHNIKRRVYDALNVLISAQILQKDGKKVICNCNLKGQNSKKLFLQQQKQRIGSQVALKQQILSEKRLALNKLQIQQKKLLQIFTKNKALGPRPVNSIKLPFIAAKSNTLDIGRVELGKREVVIDFKSNIIIMGDVDTLYQIQNQFCC